MALKRCGTIQGLLWVSCVLFQFTVIVRGESNSTIDGEAFDAWIARLERPLRFDLGPGSARRFRVLLPLNGTTNPDAIITLSPSRQANVDIFCSPGTPSTIASPLSDIRTAPWRSDHAHGDDFVFISRHHPRYAEGFQKNEEGDVVEVYCTVRNNEYYPASSTVQVDYRYDETIEMREEDEEVMAAILTKCCQSDDSCKAWKEHRANSGSVKSDLCHFHMNFCNADGHLFRLSLENFNMKCEFPYKEITQFRQLKKLLLKGNKFTGNVSRVLEELSKLPELEDVDISDSLLTGPLADGGAVERSGICTLARSALLYLNLEHNKITGELPACLLNGLSNIKTVDLAFNKITGKLPRTSGFSGELEALDLTGNQLTGEIPASYANGSSLEILYLSENQFTGSVPGEFGLSPSLRHLNLSENELSGTYPERLTETNTLRRLDLSSNHLTGELHDSIGDMNLDVLVLGSNDFTGSLPLSLSNLRSLRILRLNNNSLTGSIQNALPSSLFLLDLRDNQFTGAIPGTVSRLGNEVIRSSVHLSNNNFSSFDSEWYRKRVPMLRLAWFDAANNGIKGRFPPTLESALLLLELDLSSNDLSGPLPSRRNVFRFLLLLNLSSNAFTGPIPESWERSRLFNEDNDTTVDLSFNQLSGAIPDFFYRIPMNGAVNKTIDLEGNDFDVECPLTKSLSFIHGLVCDPNYSASPITEGEEEIGSSVLSSSNAETTTSVETQSRERGSNKSNREALLISVVVVVGFALMVAAFFVIRSRSNFSKAAASGGAAGGGRKPVPLVSLSTLGISKAIPPQREPSKDDGIHMLTGVQSSAEI